MKGAAGWKSLMLTASVTISNFICCFFKDALRRSGNLTSDVRMTIEELN
jgi:hypothetical protein